MPTKLSNINLFVGDVARSARFYSKTFGLGWDEASSFPGFAYLDGGAISITLQPAGAPGAVLGQAESVEIGFETDDLEGVRRKLEAAGVAVAATQVMGWGTTFDARDPDGFRLTVFTKGEGAEATGN